MFLVRVKHWPNSFLVATTSPKQQASTLLPFGRALALGLLSKHTAVENHLLDSRVTLQRVGQQKVKVGEEFYKVLILGNFCITWCLPAVGDGSQEQQQEASFSVMGSVQVLGKRILSPARAKPHVLVKDIESPQLLTTAGITVSRQLRYHILQL